MPSNLVGRPVLPITPIPQYGFHFALVLIASQCMFISIFFHPKPIISILFILFIRFSNLYFYWYPRSCHPSSSSSRTKYLLYSALLFACSASPYSGFCLVCIPRFYSPALSSLPALSALCIATGVFLVSLLVSPHSRFKVASQLTVHYRNLFGLLSLLPATCTTSPLAPGVELNV